MLNNIRRREIRNYVGWIVRQHEVSDALVTAGRIVAGRLWRRLTSGGWVPPYLQDLIASGNDIPASQDKSGHGDEAQDGPEGFRPANESDSSTQELIVPLATGGFSLAAGCDWDFRGEDAEDTAALHRFGWGLQLLAVSPTQSAAGALLALVEDWIRRAPRDQSHPAWQSYTVSERIAHWLLLLMVSRRLGTASASQRSAVLDSIREQANLLSRRLEYHGAESTNNHLLNNGRALYMAGCLAEAEYAGRIGRMIVMEEPKRRFSPSGFLLEGSSHYHLLLTRSLIELVLVARLVGDAEVEECLGVLAKDAVRRARFFLPETAECFPLIGDVSPDFPPEWLLGICRPGSGRVGVVACPREDEDGDWLALLGKTGAVAMESVRTVLDLEESRSAGVLAFPDAGWYRCVMPRYWVLWHASANRPANQTCHAHHDLGGFELHIERQPFVVDVGRSTYQPTTDGQAWRSARVHNTLLVDEHEPCVTAGFNDHAAMMDSYRKARLDVAWHTEGDNHALEIHFDGFVRLPGVGLWTRRFELQPDRIVVRDQLEGHGTHVVESFYHCHPDVQLEHDVGARRLTLRRSQTCVRVSYDFPDLQAVTLSRMGMGGDDPSSGRFSPCYGKVVPTWSIRFRQAATLPAKWTVEFLLE